jgi:hypothetical protein
MQPSARCKTATISGQNIRDDKKRRRLQDGFMNNHQHHDDHTVIQLL